MEVDVLGPLPVPDTLSNSPNGLCGRKATLNCNTSELGSCVKVDVDVLGPLPVPDTVIILTVSVDVKQH